MQKQFFKFQVLIFTILVIASNTYAGNRIKQFFEKHGFKSEAGITASVSNTSITKSQNYSGVSGISGTEDSLSWLLEIKGLFEKDTEKRNWKTDYKFQYGKTDNEESSDLIDIDSVYKFKNPDPLRWWMFVSAGIETEFNGGSITGRERFLNPFLYKLSFGMGKTIFPKESRYGFLDFRLGIRGQQTLIRYIENTDFTIGVEAILDYTKKLNEYTDIVSLLETYTEFEDLGHITMRWDTGLDVRLMKYLTLNMSLLAYYETQPDEKNRMAGTKYNKLAIKSMTTLGLTYKFF